MRILITGAAGQVGHEFSCVQHPSHLLIPLGRQECDITDRTAILTALNTYSPDIVVNAAAYTAVDRAEQEPLLAEAINHHGPAYLAAACDVRKIPLIHISTDYVFDGATATSYGEDDPTAPLGIYGRTKLAGEQAIRAALSRHIIVRTSWVFGSHGNNFVKTMLRLGREREELRVVNDQYGCPTPAADIACTILRIIDSVAASPTPASWGTYHYCGTPATSWFHFAEEIFRQAAKLTDSPIPRLIPITSDQYPTPAKRPANSILSCAKLTETFGISPLPWPDGLNAVLTDLVEQDRSHA